MLKKLGIAAITALLFLAPQVALALAPGEPDIYILASPSTQDVSAGGSAEFQIAVISQEGFEGEVELTLVDPPEGVTASFEPNPVDVPAYDQGVVVMTVDVASDASQGEVALKVVGKGVKETNIEGDVNIQLNIVGGGQQPPPEQPPPEQPPPEQPPPEQPPPEQPPPEQPPPEQPPPEGQVVTVTTTTTLTMTTTATTTTSVVSTVTQVITTRTSAIATRTVLPGFDQAADLTYPAVTLVVVVVLLAVAAITLRRPGA